jgi:hypothetical protein
MIRFILRLLGIDQQPRPTEEGRETAHEADQTHQLTSAIKDAVDRASREYDAHQEKQSTDNRRSRTIAWFALIAACGVGVVAIFQWCEMRKAVEEAQRSTEFTNRPWLTAIKADSTLAYYQSTAELKFGLGTKPRVMLTLRNSGKIPAKDVVIHRQIDRFTSLPSILNYEQLEARTLGAIPPETPMIDDTLVKSAFYPVTEVDAFWKPCKNDGAKCLLLIWGRVVYSDVFEKPRTSRFCFLFDARSADWLFVFCPIPNSNTIE